MHWKAHFFLNNNNKKKQGRSEMQNFWIQTKHPYQTRELDNFEKDLFNVVASLKFRKLNDSFQQKIKSDITEIKLSLNVFIFADKTSNTYKAAP